jgi:hypothetical protein
MTIYAFRLRPARLLRVLILTVFAGFLLAPVQGQENKRPTPMDIHEAVKKGLVDVTFLCTETNVTVRCHRRTAEPVVLSLKRAQNGLIQFGVGDFTKIKGFSIGRVDGAMMLRVESPDGDIDSKWGVLLRLEKDEAIVDLTSSDSGTVVLPPCGLFESYDPTVSGLQAKPMPVKEGKFVVRTNETGKLEMFWGGETAYCSPTK